MIIVYRIDLDYSTNDNTLLRYEGENTFAIGIVINTTDQF